MHNLTTQEMITNKSLLCYCIQIEFTSLVRIKTLCLLYLLSVVEVKQAVAFFGFVFPREFSSLSSEATWVVRAPSVALVWRLETAAWRHRESSPLQSSNSWLRYGFGTVLDPLRWLVPRWASSGPARVGGRSRENGKRSFDEFHSSRESREKRGERARRSRVVLNSPFFGHPQRRLVQSERRYGAEPRLHGFFMEKRITFDFCIKTPTRFTHL